MKFNPFSDQGITNYEQFKKYPFLVFGTLRLIQNRIAQQKKQIKNGYFFGERLIILGERGIGKTSTLFFVKDSLSSDNINVELFSRLPEDAEHFSVITGKTLAESTQRPIYILIDFPDTIETGKFRKFLNFLWTLMTHRNYNKINLIFAMNKSHYEKSFSYSEIFGKFMTLRLERFNRDETEELITSRLRLIDMPVDAIFPSDIINIIFEYSKGIPRNIISACSLLVDSSNGNKVQKSDADAILKERYFEQVINDRVEDLELKRIYKQMVQILQSDFNGHATNQEEYVKRVREILELGRNSILCRIKELEKFGIFSLYRGGYNRRNKIISLR